LTRQVKQLPRREKSKPLLQLSLQRSPNTVAGWENLQKKTRTKSFRAPGEIDVFAPLQHHIVFLILAGECLADDLKIGTQNAEIILIS